MFIFGNEPHITETSPCRDAGANMYADGIQYDIDGEPRIYNDVVDIGCDEYNGVELIVKIIADITNCGVGTKLDFLSDINIPVDKFVWEIENINITNELTITHSWTNAGDYDVILTAFKSSDSVSATATVHVIESFTNYVSLVGAHISPFLNWNNAATNIQAAVDSAVAGGTIMVTNGVYKIGGAPAIGHSLSNRVMVSKPLTIQSVNGATNTIIAGQFTNNLPRMRCAYLTKGAGLKGFTLTHGSTLITSQTNNFYVHKIQLGFINCFK